MLCYMNENGLSKALVAVETDQIVCWVGAGCWARMPPVLTISNCCDFTILRNLAIRCDRRLNSVTNKQIKMNSFKSSENIQKKEGGPDRSVRL